MKYSYNWLKWYVPDAPNAEKLSHILTYHLAEVESMEKLPDGDSVFEIKILPNRAHDLLSHQGLAREISSLLNIKFVDPTPKYKVPESKPTELKVEIKTDACKRYMGRIIRGVKVGLSPDWVIKHLESIGQRSINNVVDATNIVMFDCGEPTHIFDLDKIKGPLFARQAQDGETVITLDGKECKLSSSDFVIADAEKALIIGGVKGGKTAEVNTSTTNLVLEVGNFDAVTVRKTSTRIGIRTEGSKRWENGVSPELASYGMLELSALIAEMCPEATFEDVVDVYPKRQEERKLAFSADKVSKILGVHVSNETIEDILKRYNFKYQNNGRNFEISVPPMRLDLVIEEDMAEEIGRIMGYDRVKPVIPKIDFKPKINETYAKISWAREKLLGEGYSEVMTYVFRDKGEVEVMQSASDKKFLRTNLSEGLTESLKLNQLNSPVLGMNEIKIFEIGAIFKKDDEEIRVAYGDKKEIKEVTLEEFTKPASPDAFTQSLPVRQAGLGSFASQSHPSQKHTGSAFRMWPLFPFIARDVAVWVPSEVESSKVYKVVKENAGELLIKDPELFDEFKKEGKTSYAFRLVFQSYDRTLTDAEVGGIMEKIHSKIKENSAWQVR